MWYSDRIKDKGDKQNMHSAKKWFAWALVLLMALQAPAALANAKAPLLTVAVMEGREINYTASLKWHGIPELDEETNSLIAQALESIVLTGNSCQTGDSGYQHMDLQVSGESAMTMDTVARPDGVYMSSPAYGEPFAIMMDELEGVLTNYGNVLDSILSETGTDMGGMYGTMFANYGKTLQTMVDGAASGETLSGPVGETADYDAMMDELGLTDFADACTAWAEETFAGAPYEGEIDSAFGVKPASATVYACTKADLMALLDEAIPLLRDNDAYWQFIIDLVNANVADMDDIAEELDPEEFEAMMEEIRAMMDEMLAMADVGIPDDTIAQYIEGVDAEGNLALGQIQVLVPAMEEGAEPFQVYAEWIPGTCSFAGYLGYESDGFQILAQSIPETAAELDGAAAAQTGFNATLAIVSGDTSTPVFSVNTTTLEADLAKASTLAITIHDAYSGDMGVVFDTHQTNVQDGVDVAQENTVDISYVMGGAPVKVLTATLSLKSGEPTGEPFDPETMEFVHPGLMDEAEFYTWVETVGISSMQTAMRILSLLPPEVFSTLVQSGSAPAN